jgi:hypothetical protein
VSEKARSLIATEPRSLNAMSADQYRFAPVHRSGDVLLTSYRGLRAWAAPDDVRARWASSKGKRSRS